MEEKTKITPCTCYSHDEKEGRLRIEVQLPGVDKKNISLEMRKDSFCVSAPREETEYSGCFMLSTGWNLIRQRPSMKMVFSISPLRLKIGKTG